MDMVRASPDLEPALSMPGMGDHPTAMAMYAAIITALYRRQLTGHGGEVHTSLIANGIWSNSCQVQAALLGYELMTRPPRGSRGTMNETYRTLDGRQFILVTTNPARDWVVLAKAVGRETWLTDPRFATPMERLANSPLLVAELDQIFGAETWEVWKERLSACGIAFGIVARVDDHVTDPQIEANGFFPEIEDWGLRTVDSPFYLDGVAKVAPRMAPAIGEHTAAILEELGLAPAEIEALATGG